MANWRESNQSPNDTDYSMRSTDDYPLMVKILQKDTRQQQEGQIISDFDKDS